jgi:HSP20 family molecular chaperone IbpA
MSNRRGTDVWMWADAVALLDEAERLHRHFFRLTGPREHANWEPPVDLYTRGEAEVLVVIALPGVSAESIELTVDGNELVVRARRELPARAGGAVIQRLEIPYGLFERRLALPPGHYELIGREWRDGCLQLLLATRR